MSTIGEQEGSACISGGCAEKPFRGYLPRVARGYVCRVRRHDGLLDALTRLLREPSLTAISAPLIQQELIVRLLNGGHGLALRHLVTAGSPSWQIAKVTAWLKQNTTVDASMNELAARAHMSPSTFRQHFRSVAGMSPL
jgi:transcriptional regulator GlxA family with amidase domain